jgi:hypothetical protein
MNKNKLVNAFIIGTFVSLYLLTSIISTIHVIDFFSLSNPRWMSITLAIGFELGAAASLAALITLDKMNKSLVWALFIVITGMQIQGNLYHSFINISEYSSWVELFNIMEWEPLAQKRLLAAVSGAILPLIALGFIKSLVDYIKPERESDDISIVDLDEIAEEINKGDSITNESDLEDSIDDGFEELDELEESIDELEEHISELEEEIEDEIEELISLEKDDALIKPSVETSTVTSKDKGPRYVL